METNYSKAWREWQDSEEGQRVLNSDGIKVPLRLHLYYLNRIKAAFDAGWNSRFDSTGEGRG